MKKVLLGIGIVIILAVGYWLVSPLFIEKQVSETLEDILPPVEKEQIKEEVRKQVPEVNAPEEGSEPKISEPTEEPPPEAVEPQVNILGEGQFTGLTGHSGEGTAKLLEIEGKYYVRFEDDFRVTNGPDLFVYFGRDGEYVSETRIEKLKGNIGGQNYEVPAGINPLDYNEVWVWCRAFSVPFASARLN
jgi:hypothetical protein